MKSGELTMAGGARALALRAALVFAGIAALFAANAAAQSLYKYQGPDGEWIFADRPPDDGSVVEIRELEGSRSNTQDVRVSHRFDERAVNLLATNNTWAPVELVVNIKTIRGLEFPHPDDDLTWVVPARSEMSLLNLDLLEGATTPYLQYEYRYLAGDPGALHTPREAYRVPYAISTKNPVTQAYPDIVTHSTRDSFYAIDIAMPIGTDIFAARGGVVFDVAASNFSGGLDPERDGPTANVVRILHEDGSYAIYAHLNTNSIRVRPGDVVQRGQYIADSGNTGFSSGPHLHFAVVLNVGMAIQSVPISFVGADSQAILPATGMQLTAY